MKQSLQLKLGTQLTMAPQLQQAIRLLQLSTLDLQQEVQSALESNPLLETEVETLDEPKQDQNTPSSVSASNTTVTADSSAQSGESFDFGDNDNNWDQTASESFSTQTDWRNSDFGGNQGNDDFLSELQNSAPQSLRDHLLWQLNLTSLSSEDKLIGETLIDAISDDGFLESPLDELTAALNVESDEALAVLKIIQQFDPTGCGARDLRENLLLQLDQLTPETPWRAQAQDIVGQYLTLLGKRDFRQLSRRTRLAEAQLKEIMQLIQTLTPYPGASFSRQEPQYLIPDVIVSRHQQYWQVELNPETIPRLRINNEYAALIKRADNSSQNNFLREQLQEARWFLKSLQSRHDTLLKVANKIVEKQQDFFEIGPEAMKPMVLTDIASAIGMHQSTISRVTTQKYMLTPRGVFELKYFFSSAVNTNSGEGASSTAIRALIRKLVESEHSRKPLSDSKISQELDNQGFQVARRTVAKYRESMGILSSSERKRLV